MQLTFELLSRISLNVCISYWILNYLVSSMTEEKRIVKLLIWCSKCVYRLILFPIQYGPSGPDGSIHLFVHPLGLA